MRAGEYRFAWLAAGGLLLAGACGSGARVHAAESPASTVESSVVKIFSTLRLPDPLKPWTKQAPQEVSASGIVIEGERILTNAHVVQYASQVQIQPNGSGDKLPATVLAVAPGMDLAVLKLEDPAFFKSHPALRRATQLPTVKDPVLAYGFPLGGSSLSITKGIVSRIEFVPFNLSVSGLLIQIDAAINPGNSGGPAIAGNRMIGIAFSKLGGGAENIGYIIPNEEVELFLKDSANGRYDGKPAIYDDLQTLENPALRSYLKLDKSLEGVVVHRPFKEEDAYPLKEWDVITHIGATPIDNQGQIELGKDLRVSFKYLVQRLAKNGAVPLTVVRGGKTLAVQVPVLTERPMLVRDLQGRYPSYFIFGPLCFSAVSHQAIGALKGNNGLGRSKLFMQWLDPPTAEREEIVFVSSPFFPHKLAVGYSNPMGAVVDSVNGTRIHGLRHLVAVLRDLKDPYVAIEFDQKIGESLVFDRQATVAATEEILTDNGVRAQGSPDTLEIWSKAAP
ncbi:MAG TPA: trypsin-like peptidase domain-containing protein [Steroidobacteraceae bacterium]|nr:trypsin-like peptidase domain-containing protein [Steroidobacteraceae bacterium]